MGIAVTAKVGEFQLSTTRSPYVSSCFKLPL